jgi:excisionase family DNA binding protein
VGCVSAEEVALGFVVLMVLHGRDQMDKLLTVAELAERLRVSPGTIYHWLSDDRITCVRFSARCVRFRESDIEKMLEQMTDKQEEEEE